MRERHLKGASQEMKTKDDYLEKEFNFNNAKKNPYASQLKKQITINISTEAIDYFKSESKRTSIPYQTLMNLYLTDCARKNKKLNMSWEVD